MPGVLTPFPIDDSFPEEFLDLANSYLSGTEANLQQLERELDDAHALEQAYRHIRAIEVLAARMRVSALAPVIDAVNDVLMDALDEVLYMDGMVLSFLSRSLKHARQIVGVMKTGTGSIEQVVAEHTADYAAFRQQREDKPFWPQGRTE